MNIFSVCARWTKQLVLEFFDQGDRERNLDLPISPLCDRHSAKVAQSQIGEKNLRLMNKKHRMGKLAHFCEVISPYSAKEKNDDKLEQTHKVFEENQIKKSNFHYTRAVTPERLTSVVTHLRGLTLGLRSGGEALATVCSI